MASPFRVFRKHQRVLLATIGLMAMIAFVFLGPAFDYLSSSRQARMNPVVVSWSGGDIHEAELRYELLRRAQVNRFLQLAYYSATQNGATPQIQPRLSPVTESSILNTMVMAHRAEELGLVISDSAINDYIRRITGDGVSPEQLRGIIDQLAVDGRRISEEQLFGAIRRELLAQQLEALYSTSRWSLPPAQRWEYYRKLNQHAKLEVAAVPVSDFLAEIDEPNDAQLQEFFAAYQERVAIPEVVSNVVLASPTPGFKQPPRASFAYFKADLESFAQQEEEKITDAQIREFYEKNKDRLFLAVGDEPLFRDPLGGTDPLGIEPGTPGEGSLQTGPDLGEALFLEPSSEDEGVIREEPTDEVIEEESDTSAPPTTSENIPGPPTPPLTEEELLEQEAAAQQEDEDPDTTEESDASEAEEAEDHAESDQENGSETPPVEDTSAKWRTSVMTTLAATALSQVSSPEEGAELAFPGGIEDSVTDATEPPNPSNTTDEEETTTSEDAADETTESTESDSVDDVAEEATDSEAETPAPKYRPLSEVEETIRKRLAREQAVKAMDNALNQLALSLTDYFGDVALWEAQRETADGEESIAGPDRPVAPDFESQAREQGLSFQRVGPFSRLQFQGSDAEISRTFRIVQDANSQFGFRQDAYVQFAFDEDFALYRTVVTEDAQGNRYLSWKIEQFEERTPQLADVREEVVRAWKMEQARPLALEKAKSLAQQAGDEGGNLQTILSGEGEPTVSETGLFSWLTLGDAAVDPTMMSMPRLSSVEQVDDAGPAFMQAVFSTPVEKLGTAFNHPQTHAYVFRVTEIDPSDAVLRALFLSQNFTGYAGSALADIRQTDAAWVQSLQDAQRVTWHRDPLDATR